jgi:hypothetical protein
MGIAALSGGETASLHDHPVALGEDDLGSTAVTVELGHSAAPERASEAGAVLARSHADYPSFRHLFPERGRRVRALQAMFTGVARAAARLGSAVRCRQRR